MPKIKLADVTMKGRELERHFIYIYLGCTLKVNANELHKSVSTHNAPTILLNMFLKSPSLFYFHGAFFFPIKIVKSWGCGGSSVGKASHVCCPGFELQRKSKKGSLSGQTSQSLTKPELNTLFTQTLH